jgi:hypothetical protein
MLAAGLPTPPLGQADIAAEIDKISRFRGVACVRRSSVFWPSVWPFFLFFQGVLTLC